MAKYDLSFSPEERAAIEAMTEDEMLEMAKSDPDAAPMTDAMLADIQPGRRVERGIAARVAAARRLVDKANAERDETAET